MKISVAAASVRLPASLPARLPARSQTSHVRRTEAADKSFTMNYCAYNNSSLFFYKADTDSLDE